MTRICIIVVLFLVSASSAAQQQSHIDAATELVEAMYTEESLQQIYDRFLPQMFEMSAQTGITQEQQLKFEQSMEEMIVVMKEVVTWERMKPLIVKTHVEVFTEGELRELTVFYTSPIGRKYIAKGPELAQAHVEVMGEMMRELTSRLTESQSEFRSESMEPPADSH